MQRFKNSCLLFVALLPLSACIANTSAFMRGSSIQDDDWNTPFTSNCPLPRYDSIQWVSENDQRFMRFTLADGDKGGCVTDRKDRHHAPYWERAELKQIGTLSKNRSYIIDARLRFVEGFSGDRESFFQVHAYNKACKQAYPPIMIKFDNSHTNPAVLTLNALNKNKGHNSYRSGVRINDALGKWMDMKINLNTSDKRTISVSIDGETVFSDVPFWVESCGVMHIKFGVYRPGNASGNATSVVDYDSIQVSK